MSTVYTEVVAPVAYAPTPSLESAFVPDSFSFVYVSGADAYFSFDGVNDHGRLASAYPGLFNYRNRGQKVWLRQVAGAATWGVTINTDV